MCIPDSEKLYTITLEDVKIFSTLIGTAQGMAKILANMGYKKVPDDAMKVINNAEAHLRAVKPSLLKDGRRDH